MLSAQDLPREKCYFPDSMYRRQLMTRSGDQLLEQIHHPSASELAAQSADMNSLIRNISASTDQYTGRTTVQIPLYEMTTNSGSLPIAIQYSTGGIKVDEIASVAGLGWNLMAGGRITRSVQGQPDDFNQLAQTENIHNWNRDNMDAFIDGKADTKYDLYYFEMPNSSGGFILDGSKAGHTIPYQNLKISYSEEEDSFTIYDSNGTRYIFTTTETTHETNEEAETDRTYTSSWFLDAIQYLNGAQVQFSYVSGENYAYDCPNWITYAIHVTDYFDDKIEFRAGWEKDLTTHIEVQNPKYLSSISYKEQRLDFVYDDQRNDISHLKRLRQIKVCANDMTLRTFQLDFGRFPNGSPKLVDVMEAPDSLHIKPISSFEYYEDANLPARGYYGFDHWGYCNSTEQNPSKCPSVVLGDCDNFILPDHTIKKSSAPTSAVSDGLMTQGASREPNLTLTRANSLKRVVYPNGGSKEFIYELHRGLNLKTNREENAGGLRIKEIRTRADDNALPAVYRYEYEGGVIYDDIFNYCVNDYTIEYLKDVSNPSAADGLLATEKIHGLSSHAVSSTVNIFGCSVEYEKVIEYLPNGSYTVNTFVPIETCKDLLPDRFLYYGDMLDITSQKELTGKTPKTSLAWQRNLIKESTAYAADSSIVARQTFEYKIDSIRLVPFKNHSVCSWGSGVFDSQSGFYPQKSVLLIGEYSWLSCPVLITTQRAEKGRYNFPSITTYDYNGSTVPRTITTSTPDGTTTIQNLIYPNDYAPAESDDTWIRTMVDRNVLFPIEEITHRQDYIIEASAKEYRRGGSENADILLASEKALRKKTLSYSLYTPSVYKPSKDAIEFSPIYETIRFYDEYNDNGDLLCFHEKNGLYNSFVYGSNTTFPIAHITGARYSTSRAANQIFFDDFETGSLKISDAKSGNGVHNPKLPFIATTLSSNSYVASYWYKTAEDSEWIKHTEKYTVKNGGLQIGGGAHAIPYLLFSKDAMYVDDLCLIPYNQNATITSSVIVPGLGPISETDARGRTTYYKYNVFGLLSEILDNERRVITKYTYDDLNLE